MSIAAQAIRRALGMFPPAGRCCALLAVALLAAIATLSTASAAKLDARDFKMAGDATHMRVVMHFDVEPELRWFLLRGPHRLVIELPETRFVFEPKAMKPRGLIRNVSYGAIGDGKSRVVFATKGPFEVQQAEVIKEEDGSGFRLAVDIAAASDRAFEAALADQATTTGATIAASKGARVGESVDRPAKPFSIVIDPGHGGVDGGARGVSGTVEKDITLAFAIELKNKLQSEGRFSVSLTRSTDEFLRLDDRVRIARQREADLFISVHADTINMKGIRGATVYTVSDKASDAEAQALADRENLSDQLAGIDIPDENHEVADILVDLIRRETHAFSIRFARTLVGELSNSVGLINNPHRFAGFKVLKAPDVPSVLVELGYLSNEKDEAQLRSVEWRGKAVTSIANAISEFAASKAAGG
ncbi:N-acetylmuramoyl-L-alanine amidase [Mesorhizobium yinganensis]|uniref:N-acetylmuramoyl-L-alanine amidase n=1 Tax=Mesorhizobium yinganensis TaxID=3157707 RepID=UPI003CCD428B